MRVIKTASMLGILLACEASPGFAGPPGSQVIMDNPSVLAFRFRIEAHGSIPMHEVPPHLVVWLTDADLKVIRPDGGSEILHFKAGDVQWVELGRHAGLNLDAKPIEFIAVEPKQASP